MVRVIRAGLLLHILLLFHLNRSSDHLNSICNQIRFEGWQMSGAISIIVVPTVEGDRGSLFFWSPLSLSQIQLMFLSWV